MKRFLFAAAVAAAFLSAPQAQAQTVNKVPASKAANSSAAPAADDDWGWTTGAPAQQEVSGWEVRGAETPTVVASDSDPMMQSSGVLVAPGMSSSPYRGTSTDYHGRPVVKAKSKRPRSVEVAQEDPMMRSSGVMLAPGMNTAPYRGVSTDYNGRPLRKTTANTTVTSQRPSDNSTVAAGW
ncbi:hypothetical protein ACFPAF_05125 [Hymenobacter endophyticus]|uniref:Uncharacterized protein n=1 Tax=Hymenobacter endophyticus TaxID=3076335 RepID=A0ABU3TEJ5_9BACT|nr:hypothetical protein [Hymenobacter endophyticus]MDU0369768.1 hypothetical protein [Hymenobacter endophyticus]